MRILLIVTGGIAAVKIYDLVRGLTAKGHEVTVILTASAQHFVTPLALTTLTHNKVHTDLFDITTEENIGHIALSRGADVILVAPATAHIIGQYACGLASDLATTCLLASNCPVFFAPAMNVKMWEHPAVQKNIQILQARGVKIIPPTSGIMACKEEGMGRMAEVSTIIETLEQSHHRPLQGKKILITAGATREKIDPVRYISNHSSGKQGYALAQSFASQGAEVFLVSGVTYLNHPNNMNFISIETAGEMLEACENIVQNHIIDIGIFCAAVCDWKTDYTPHKLKKNPDISEMTLVLRKNPDILQIISNSKHRPKIMAGFAAETDNHLDNAMIKLEAKGCDVIFMNDVTKNIFGTDDNHIIMCDKAGTTDLGSLSKKDLADIIRDNLTGLTQNKKIVTPWRDHGVL